MCHIVINRPGVHLQVASTQVSIVGVETSCHPAPVAVFPAWAVCLVSSLPLYITNGDRKEAWLLSPLISLSRFTVSDSRACVCLRVVCRCVPQTVRCAVDGHLNVVRGFEREVSEGHVPSREITGQSMCTHSASGETVSYQGAGNQFTPPATGPESPRSPTSWPR